MLYHGYVFNEPTTTSKLDILSFFWTFIGVVFEEKLRKKIMFSSIFMSVKTCNGLDMSKTPVHCISRDVHTKSEVTERVHVFCSNKIMKIVFPQSSEIQCNLSSVSKWFECSMLIQWRADPTNSFARHGFQSVPRI